MNIKKHQRRSEPMVTLAMAMVLLAKAPGRDALAVVRTAGLEPTLLFEEADFKSAASTNFATPAFRRPPSGDCFKPYVRSNVTMASRRVC
jgi:hypothetical protein